MPSVYSILYTAYTVVTLPIRLLTWWLYYIPKSTRPNLEWSWKGSVGLQIIKLLIGYRTAIRYRTPKSLEPGLDGDRFIVLNPQKSIKYAGLKEETVVYKGTITSVPGIEPVPIGGVWYPTTPIAPPRKLIIHFHPSAYVLFGPRPVDSVSWGTTKFAERTGWPILSVQYRLSLDADKTFPAAVQDGITAYVYALKTLKIPSSQIVFSGESAGGNLVIAMLRYLTTENSAISLPRCALLWSPWVDMTDESLERLVKNPNYSSDYIQYDLLCWGASGYTPAGWSRENPYLSPLGRECALSVPLFIEAGTAEVFYDSIVHFAQNMKQKGTEVEFREAPNASHAIFGTAVTLDMVDVSLEGHVKAAEFIDRTGERMSD